MRNPTHLEKRDPQARSRDLRAWRAAASGDPDARARILQLTREVTERHLGRALRWLPWDEAEDLHQDMAAGVLWRLRAAPCPRVDVEACLRWHARAALKEILRRRNKRPSTCSRADLGAMPARGPTPYETLARDDSRTTLLGCIRALPNADHRRAWLGRYLDGLSPHDIAARLGTRSVTVRTWIKRGRESMLAKHRTRLAAL